MASSCVLDKYDKEKVNYGITQHSQVGGKTFKHVTYAARKSQKRFVFNFYFLFLVVTI